MPGCWVSGLLLYVHALAYETALGWWAALQLSALSHATYAVLCSTILCQASLKPVAYMFHTAESNAISTSCYQQCMQVCGGTAKLAHSVSSQQV
jgi:hypothetical protein